MQLQATSSGNQQDSAQIERQVERELRCVTDTWLKAFTPAIRRRLDGTQGRHRPRTPEGTILPCECSGVKDDVAAIAHWLSRYGYPHEKSYLAYRKECLRLIRWAWKVKRIPISSLERKDLEEFMAFLANPPADWLGARYRLLTPEGHLNPAWRPFERPLQPASIVLSCRVLNSMLRHLNYMGYVGCAPWFNTGLLERTRTVSSVKRRDGEQALLLNKRQNVFSPAEIEAIRETAAEGPPVWSWMIALFRYAGLNCEDATRHYLRDIQISASGQLILKIRSHNGRRRAIPFDAELSDAYLTYCQAMNFSPCPFVQDRSSTEAGSPLIPGPRGAYSTRNLEWILKKIFTRASQRLRREDPEGADRLLYASPKWFRNGYVKQRLSESDDWDTITEMTGLSTYTLSRFSEAFKDKAGVSEPAHLRIARLLERYDIL